MLDQTLAPVDVPVLRPPGPADAHWHPATRVAFRLGVVYFTLYVVSTQMLGSLIAVPDLGRTAWLQSVIRWTAIHAFHVAHPVNTISGSGDRLFDWVQAFVLLIVAIAATAIWSAADWRSASYPRLQKWFRVFLRFALGATMATYGTVKAIPLQMPAVLMRLVEPYGHFSPMGVLWASVGSSFPYERTVGCMELAAAILLFVPGLTVLGALVCLVDVVQVFILNMTYDVPVKLFSFHLILMSLFLLAPDTRRLVRVLVLDRDSGAPARAPLFLGRRARTIAVGVQLLAAAAILAVNFTQARHASMQSGAAASPLYGIWDVTEMTVDGHVRPPLLTDSSRWRRVVSQFPGAIRFQRMDDSFVAYRAAFDEKTHTVTLSQGKDQNWKAPFTYERPDADHLVLDGAMDGHHTGMTLSRVDLQTFLLVSRGFHWVQEVPFNR